MGVSTIGLTHPAYVAALSESCCGIAAKLLIVAIRGRVGAARAGMKKRRREREHLPPSGILCPECVGGQVMCYYEGDEELC